MTAHSAGIRHAEASGNARLAYLLVFTVILGILDWYRRPAPEIPDVTPKTQDMTVVVSVPASTAL